MPRLEATVHGHVQGVGFRWFVNRHARRLNLAGWVANEADGTVRVVAEGEASVLAQLVTMLRQGPPGASVEAVDEEWLPASGLMRGFGVRSGAHTGD